MMRCVLRCLHLPWKYDSFPLHEEDGADWSTLDTTVLVWMARGRNSRLDAAFPFPFIRAVWKVDPLMHVVVFVVAPLPSDTWTCW